MEDLNKQIGDIDRCLKNMKNNDLARIANDTLNKVLKPIPDFRAGIKGVSSIKVDSDNLQEFPKEDIKSDKREDVISWDECFMRLASTVALRSKDPSTQVGACIVNTDDHRIVSLGYNGFPYGCSDDEFPWDKSQEDNKYLYVVHAELNAILSAKKDLSNHTLYVTYFPCNECMKAIIQSGIKHIVYMNDYRAGQVTSIASLKMAKAAGIDYRKYTLEK